MVGMSQVPVPALPDVVPGRQKPRFHIWARDGRTLCDLKSFASAYFPDDDDPMPRVCGSCIVAVELLRADAKYLRVMFGDPDQTYIEALEALRHTRWDAEPDIDQRIRNCIEIDGHYPELTDKDRDDYRRYHAEAHDPAAAGDDTTDDAGTRPDR